MADKVNEQTTDSVSQVTVNTLGIAPAQAMATLYQTSTAAAAMAMQNAVHAQNNQYALANAVMVEAVNLLLSSPKSATTIASEKIENALTKFAERIAAINKPEDPPK
ncbi:RebB family R body protein [Nannocystaceae bacterium ST9]